MKVKGQKGFSILNVIVGVILIFASVMMFMDPSTYPGPFIALPLGIVIFVCGFITMSKVRLLKLEGKPVTKSLLLVNRICFIVSCLILAACVLLPVFAPMF